MHELTTRGFAIHELSQRDNPPLRPDENQGPVILGATLTVTIAALLAVIARLYVRVRMIRNIGWDVSMIKYNRLSPY
jgi:hypothetical protein